jgi:hypothetical protein
MNALSDEEQAIQYRSLLSGVITAAVDDYRHCQRLGVIRQDGSLNFARLGPRTSRNYFKVDGMKEPSEFTQLVHFFKGGDLDFLCDLTGNHACRIRRELGIEGGAL